MRTILIVLLCVAFVSARWSIYSAKASDDDHDHDHDHEELDWWEHGVFYQIYPNSFKDSDGNGIGDLKGIIEKLDHLKDLGVTGAWLSPIFESPMIDGGYDIQDFKKVNPRFGTNEDLKDLFAKAKELGIKIILDFVPNHTSDQHEWFQLSRNRTEGYEDYYIWKDCPYFNESDPELGRRYVNNWIAVFHTPAWSYDEVRGQCYLHQFTPQQPDLNYRNKEVYDNMMEILEYWLKEGADGFRIDAINHLFEVEELFNEPYIDMDGDKTSYDNINHINTMNQPESYEFIYDVREMMDRFVENSEDKVTKLMMTEAYATVEEQVKWYGANDTRRGAHFPFNFALITSVNSSSNAQNFTDAIDKWRTNMPVYGIENWVMGNHDRPRVAYRYGENRAESLAIMTMMLPGLNVIYYGEEILMTNNMDIKFSESDDPQAKQTNETVYMLYTRDPVRTPFQWDDTKNAGFSDTDGKTWLPIHENYKTRNLAAQKAAEKSTYKLYQSLIELRKKNHVLQIGGYEGKAVDEDVFGFTRTLKDHATIAVFVNLGSATTVSLKDLLDEDDFSSKTKAKILIVNNESKLPVGKMVDDVEKISLGDYDAVVLEVSSSSKVAISMLLFICSLIKLLF